jgi:hypothetical protein
MSDTPRTDEQINGKPCTRFEILAGDSLRNAAVPSEFARTIERELNAAQERIKRLEEAGDEMYKFINPPSPCMRTSRMDNLLQDWDDAKININ